VISNEVQYPDLGTNQTTLYFSPHQTCSTEHHLNLSEKHSGKLQIMPINISSTISSQVLIHTATTLRVGNMDQLTCTWFDTAVHDSNPGSLDCDSDALFVKLSVLSRRIRGKNRQSFACACSRSQTLSFMLIFRDRPLLAPTVSTRRVVCQRRGGVRVPLRRRFHWRHVRNRCVSVTSRLCVHARC